MRSQDDGQARSRTVHLGTPAGLAVPKSRDAQGAALALQGAVCTCERAADQRACRLTGAAQTPAQRPHLRDSTTQIPSSTAGMGGRAERQPHPPHSPLRPMLTTLQACTGHADHNTAKVEMGKVDILASSLWRAGRLQTRWSLCNGPTLLPRHGHGHGRVPHTCGRDPLWATTSEALLSSHRGSCMRTSLQGPKTPGFHRKTPSRPLLRERRPQSSKGSTAQGENGRGEHVGHGQVLQPAA